MTSKVYINGEAAHGETAILIIDRAEWRGDTLFLYSNGDLALILGGYTQDQITFDKGFEAIVKTTAEAPDDLTAAIDVLLGVM